MHLNVAIESISTPPNLLNQCLYWHCSAGGIFSETNVMFSVHMMTRQEP